MAKRILPVLILILLPLLAPASDMEYVSPDKQGLLERQFAAARFTPSHDTEMLKNHQWTCEMYGVRSHLQVQHDLNLYRWSVDEHGQWHNAGAQLVSEYKAQPLALVGHKDRFEDQVKINADGSLIARLSVTSPKNMVIAYSVCK